MRIETALATASLTRVERRDPYKRKNKIKLADLEQMVPSFDWAAYYRTLKAPQFEIINAAPPAFFKELEARLKDEPIASLRSYLRFHLANSYAAYLSSPFVQENFEFYLKYLRGAKESNHAGSAACNTLTAIWAKRWGRPTCGKYFRRN